MIRPATVAAAACLFVANLFPVPTSRVNGQEPMPSGPASEARFPPLVVPAGFKATLFACDPFIEYPSVIALGPRPGRLYVAIDYVSGLGSEFVRHSEVRLLEDGDGDGYADKSTVFASNLNSIQGLAGHRGTVYVMHAPFLTALRDTGTDGVADERKDLFTGFGLPPEKNPSRLHCANGVTAGYDGWLYLALGDNGVDVVSPEGDRLVLHGGGILRCRPDGSDLHVFATGLRNIYDIALDEDLNVFIRDNENDGGDYKIRVCHSFFGADHGYPYKYYERPDEALPPLADLGLGSSAGGAFYLETQFPPEYRGNLFFCEWGRSVVRYRPARVGSGFAPPAEIEFAAGDPADPYGFKPTDVVVDGDGSLFVADWADGQQTKGGRGRVYRISHQGQQQDQASKGPESAVARDLIAALDSESYHTRLAAQEALEDVGEEAVFDLRRAQAEGRLGLRGRMHAIWITARVLGSEAVDELFAIACRDSEPRVQAAAVRAIADLADPVLACDRLDASDGDEMIAARLAELAVPAVDDRGRQEAGAAVATFPPEVALETVIALGRLRWPGTPNWLRQTFDSDLDAALAHAAMMAMRRSRNWADVLEIVDLPDGSPMRAIALRALAEQADITVVDGLIERLQAEKDSARRLGYADLLSRVNKLPGEWVYWGYRPAPRPSGTEQWERTESITQALNRALENGDVTHRVAILERMQREQVTTSATVLLNWLRDEVQPESLRAILASLREQPAPLVREQLADFVADIRKPAEVRVEALAILVEGLDEQSETLLIGLGQSLGDGPVLVEVIRQLGRRPRLSSISLLVEHTAAVDAAVRAEAVAALTELNATAIAPLVPAWLADPDCNVRRVAAEAAGKLGVSAACDSLLKLAGDPDPLVRCACFGSLRLLRESRAVDIALAALTDHQTQREAVLYLAELGGPQVADAVIEVARQNRSAEVASAVIEAIDRWSSQQPDLAPPLDRAVAELQGECGVLVRWLVTALPAENASHAETLSLPTPTARPEDGADLQTVFGSGVESVVHFGLPVSDGKTWLAYGDIHVGERSEVQFLTAASGTARYWVNGKLLHSSEEAGPFALDRERFDGVLEPGFNRVLVELTAPATALDFHVRFRRKSDTATHEQLTQAALAGAGDVESGRRLFANAEKTQCVKCHRMGEAGEPIGPELTGVGSRFSRIHVIESILDPSRAILPSYQAASVVLRDGRVLVGLKLGETQEAVTYADNQGKRHELQRADIEQVEPQRQSIMPAGLEKTWTTDEFVDLVAYLVAQREER